MPQGQPEFVQETFIKLLQKQNTVQGKQDRKRVGIDGNLPMKIETIASGSTGNCYVISDEIMIECGLPISQIKRERGYTLHEIQACLISHGH